MLSCCLHKRVHSISLPSLQCNWVSRGSRLQWRGQPVAIAAQGCRLGLPTPRQRVPQYSKNAYFWLPTHDPRNFVCLKPSLGHPGATPEIWKRSSQPFPSFKRTYIHTKCLLCINSFFLHNTVSYYYPRNGVILFLQTVVYIHNNFWCRGESLIFGIR